MKAKAKVNFDDLYKEIHNLKIRLEVEPKDPNKWWNFLKDINFWIAVINIIFKYFFK